MAEHDSKIKHLELIQLTIGRMASNSFLLKAWSTAIIAALFALAANDSNGTFIIVAYVPLITFWGLDAYYVTLERRFRHLYDIVRVKTEDQIDFSMEPPHLSNIFLEWFRAVISLTISAFYLPFIVLTFIIRLIIR